jgi:hypothetical protein
LCQSETKVGWSAYPKPSRLLISLNEVKLAGTILSRTRGGMGGNFLVSWVRDVAAWPQLGLAGQIFLGETWRQRNVEDTWRLLVQELSQFAPKGAHPGCHVAGRPGIFADPPHFSHAAPPLHTYIKPSLPLVKSRSERQVLGVQELSTHISIEIG